MAWVLVPVSVQARMSRISASRAGTLLDLEDELIRALGVAGVERVLAAENDLARFRAFQNQPAQRGRAVERQLRRFMGTISGRKARYARALVFALDSHRIPRPLDHLLASF
jgi:hypothetical protein